MGGCAGVKSRAISRRLLPADNAHTLPGGASATSMAALLHTAFYARAGCTAFTQRGLSQVTPEHAARGRRHSRGRLPCAPAAAAAADAVPQHSSGRLPNSWCAKLRSLAVGLGHALQLVLLLDGVAAGAGAGRGRQSGEVRSGGVGQSRGASYRAGLPRVQSRTSSAECPAMAHVTTAPRRTCWRSPWRR